MKVLLLSADPADRARVSDWLRSRGYTVFPVSTSAKAAGALEASSPRFVFVDLAARHEALKFLRSLVTDQHQVWTVAIADRHDAGVTAEALRLGAVDIVPRPLEESSVIAALANAREVASLPSRRQGPAIDEVSGDGVLALSPRMREVYELARRMASSRCPVLLVGERGTGRETIARTIHRHGPLGSRTFWKIAAGPGGASELKERSSKDEGTIYIEELGELPADGQARLARLLADSRAHEASKGRGGFRVIAAAQPYIESLAERRVVSRALVDALSVLRLELPPLRERPQDIPALAMHLLKEACGRHGIPAKSLSRSALSLLASLPWRGNAYELNGLVERLAVLVARGVILQEDVLQHVRIDGAQSHGGPGTSLRGARRQFEREFIAAALQRNQWRMDAAARELGIERTNLYRKMKQLEITRPDGSA